MRERKGESERDKRRGKPRKFERERGLERYINTTFQNLGKKPGIKNTSPYLHSENVDRGHEREQVLRCWYILRCKAHVRSSALSWVQL